MESVVGGWVGKGGPRWWEGGVPVPVAHGRWRLAPPLARVEGSSARSFGLCARSDRSCLSFSRITTARYMFSASSNWTRKLSSECGAAPFLNAGPSESPSALPHLSASRGLVRLKIFVLVRPSLSKTTGDSFKVVWSRVSESLMGCNAESLASVTKVKAGASRVLFGLFSSFSQYKSLCRSVAAALLKAFVRTSLG